MLNTYAYAYDYLIHRDVPEWLADEAAKKLESLDSRPHFNWTDELLNDFVDIWRMEQSSKALDIISESLV